jgi:hypothetical protein
MHRGANSQVDEGVRVAGAAPEGPRGHGDPRGEGADDVLRVGGIYRRGGVREGHWWGGEGVGRCVRLVLVLVAIGTVIVVGVGMSVQVVEAVGK